MLTRGFNSSSFYNMATPHCTRHGMLANPTHWRFTCCIAEFGFDTRFGWHRWHRRVLGARHMSQYPEVNTILIYCVFAHHLDCAFRTKANVPEDVHAGLGMEAAWMPVPVPTAQAQRAREATNAQAQRHTTATRNHSHLKVLRHLVGAIPHSLPPLIGLHENCD